MINFVKKAVNFSGNDLLLSMGDIEFNRRVISISGEINEALAAQINPMLRCLAHESAEDITIYIQSPGGSVLAGLSIYDTIKAIRCDVCTVGCGSTASMAAFLLSAAGTKGKRYIQPNAELLIHQPLGGVNGQASDIKIHTEHLLGIRDKLARILAECTGQPVERIHADTDRDHYMNAEEALAYGLVDRIGDPISDI